jgi:hypothetical protein
MKEERSSFLKKRTKKLSHLHGGTRVHRLNEVPDVLFFKKEPL